MISYCIMLYHLRYHGHMILVWHRTWDNEMTNNLHLNFYFKISSCIYQYMYLLLIMYLTVHVSTIVVSPYINISYIIRYHIASINIVISSQYHQISYQYHIIAWRT